MKTENTPNKEESVAVLAARKPSSNEGSWLDRYLFIGNVDIVVILALIS